MKIALSFPGCHRRGGVERVLVECLNFLARRGHEVHAFASHWDRSALRPEVNCHPVPVRGWLPAGRVASFRCVSANAITALQPDAVGSFGVVAPPGSVVWMQSVHAAWIETSQQTRPLAGRVKQWLNPFHRTILRMERDQLRGRQYRKVIALTPQVQTDLERHYGVPPADIVVLPNGYSAAEFNVAHRRARRADMRRQLGFEDSHRVIVFVANEIERKGLVPLLRGVARLRDRSLRVLAVGRLDASAVASEIRALGLHDSVRFTGLTNETADFYAASDLFALPTKYEAWGLVIIEALACGLPVITSRLAGASVAVEEGRTGALLDHPADPDEIADKLGQFLRQGSADADAIAASVQRFEWNRLLEDYETILSTSVKVPA